MEKIEFIGFIAAFFTTFAYIPQCIKIHRSKSAKDLSLNAYINSSIGIILWIIYGFSIVSYPILLSNAIALVLVGYIIAAKLKWIASKS